MIRINLLPTPAGRAKVRKKKKPATAVPMVFIAAIAITILCLGGVFYYLQVLNAQLKKAQDEQTKKTEELATLKKLGDQVDKMESDINEMVYKRIFVEHLKMKQSEPVKVLDGLVNNLPDNVWIDSLNMVEMWNFQEKLVGEKKTRQGIKQLLELEWQRVYTVDMVGSALAIADVTNYVDKLKAAQWKDSLFKMFTSVYLDKSTRLLQNKTEYYNFAIKLNVANPK